MRLRHLGGALWRERSSVLAIWALAAVVVVVLLAATEESSVDREPRAVILTAVVLAVLLTLVAAPRRDRRRHLVSDGLAVEEASSAPLVARVAPPRDPATLPALDPGAQAAEVFAHLRLAVDTDAGDGPRGRIVVAGASAGDVNVWLGANLAVSLALAGHRALLVDGRMGARFGSPAAAEPDTLGLHDVLAGARLSAAVSPGPVTGLSVLPSGSGSGRPPEALIESRFGEVMADAQESFDVIVVLAPSLDVSDDARLMAAGAALLLAVPEGHLSVTALRTHAERVRTVGARLLGVVLVARRPDRIAA